jgi:hypothetical protein
MYHITIHSTVKKRRRATLAPYGDRLYLQSRASPASIEERPVPITGGCLCGKVRYEIAAEAPNAVRQCWCRLCQYLSAGGGTINAVFNKDAFRVSGETKVFTSTADSGATMHRSFCPSCGTPLFSEAESRPQVIIVRAGALDDPNLAKPAAIIWTKAAPKWACFDPALPRVEGQQPAR